MIAALALAATLESAPGRFRQAEVELIGPLEDVRCEVRSQASTLLHAQLVAGERRVVVVPIAAGADARDLELVEVPEREGSARWIGWTREGAAELERRWNELPAGLRARAWPVPPAPPSAERVPRAALLALLAFVPIALSLRKRRAALALLSVVFAALVAGVWGRRLEPSGAVRIVEVDGASGAALAVDAGRERLDLPLEPPLSLATDPEHARVEAEVTLGAPTWRLRAPAATVLRWEPPTPAELELVAGLDAPGRFEARWTRTPQGEWSYEGREPAESSAPPGWLNPALPMGTKIVIARAAGSTHGPRRTTWVRWIGP